MEPQNAPRFAISENSVKLQEFIELDYANQQKFIKELGLKIKKLEKLQELNLELQSKFESKLVITKRFPFIKFKQHEPTIPLKKSNLLSEPWNPREIKVLKGCLPVTEDPEYWINVSNKMATANFIPRSPEECQAYYQRYLNPDLDYTPVFVKDHQNPSRRTKLQLFAALKQKQFSKAEWTPFERKRLLKLVEYYDVPPDKSRPSDWLKVKSHFQGRRIADCKREYQRLKNIPD